MAQGASGRLLAGLPFRLHGFADDDERRYKLEIEKRGGKVTDHRLHSEYTHLLACSDNTIRADPYCAAAEIRGKCTVNEYWLEDTLKFDIIADSKKIVYMLPKDLKGIKGSSSVKICFSGFNDEKKEELNRIVYLIGAYHVDIYKDGEVSHLICNRPEGDDFSSAKRSGIHVVSDTWLKECLRQWDLVPVSEHTDWTRVTPRASEKSLSKYAKRAGSPDEFRTPPRGRDYGEGRKAASTSRILSGNYVHLPLLSSSSVKRRLPTGTNLIGKNIGKSVHDFAKNEGVFDYVTVTSMPRRRKMATSDIKYLLLKICGLIKDIEERGWSIGGSFSFKDFVIETSRTVSIAGYIQYKQFTKELGLKDSDQFVIQTQELFGGENKVPLEVDGWLDSIQKHKDTALVLNHINMQPSDSALGHFTTMFHAFQEIHRDRQKLHDLRTAMSAFTGWIIRYQGGEKWEPFDQNISYRTAKSSRLQSQPGYRPRLVKNPIEDDDEDYSDDFVGLTIHVRNTFEHQARYMQALFLVVMMIIHPHFLSSLQEALYILGALPHLR